jgi:release factor glutamine methyltransferase
VVVPTVDGLLTEAVSRLRVAGSESARLDAELLLGHVLGIDRTGVVAHPEAPVGDGPAERFRAALGRREAGEPVAYIRGVKEFHGLAFGIDARALIPRPETERLVDLAEQEIVRRLTSAPRPSGTPPLRVLDVGTGSGIVPIALAVLLRRRRILDSVEIAAVDIAPETLELARENAVAHAVGDRIAFNVADLLPGTESGGWDLLLANLPYVRSDAMATMPVATAFEPPRALDGGPDGLAVIGRLLHQLPEALAVDGVAFLEIGSDQDAEIVAAVAERLPGWACVVEADLGGLPRVARIRRAS